MHSRYSKMICPEVPLHGICPDGFFDHLICCGRVVARYQGCIRAAQEHEHGRAYRNKEASG
jgi:hypothetical protein